MTNFINYSKVQKFADDNFKFDENGRKFSKQVENTVGKGEIAQYEQFPLFPLCFHPSMCPSICVSVCPCSHLCTKYPFLSKCWQGYNVTFNDSSS